MFKEAIAFDRLEEQNRRRALARLLKRSPAGERSVIQQQASRMRKQPPLLSLSAVYHDGTLVDVEFGPRREIVLSIQLDPVWNEGDDAVRRIRFSKIQNYPEVKAFFHKPPFATDGNQFSDTVLTIDRPSKTVIGIALVKRGYVELHGARALEL